MGSHVAIALVIRLPGPMTGHSNTGGCERESLNISVVLWTALTVVIIFAINPVRVVITFAVAIFVDAIGFFEPAKTKFMTLPFWLNGFGG